MSRENDHINRLTPEIMAKYRRGELSDREMHAVERLLLESELEAEAMEGMESIGTDEFLEDISALDQRLSGRLTPRRTMPAWWMAAAVVMLVVTAGILLYTNMDVTSTVPDIAEMEPPAESERPEPAPEASQQISETTDDAEEPATEDMANESPVQDSGKTPGLIADAGEVAPPKDKTAAIRSLPAEVQAEEQVAAESDEIAKDISALPRVAADSAPNVELPQPAVVAEEQSLVGIIKGDEIEIITPMPGRQLESLYGRVVDRSGNPVASARLKVRETNQAYITDNEGEFEMDLEDDADDRIIVSLVGLKAQDLVIANQDSLIILLEEDTAALSEVVIQENKPANNVIYRGAGPAGGPENFAQYLKENIPSPEIENFKPSDVSVIFTVNQDGTLSDFKVRRSPDEDFTRTVIRILRHGPDWLPALEDGSPVRDRVRVRIPESR